jgi:hypothetical protein
MAEMFEKASRMKLDFPFKGSCSVEDLWDLSVTDLDSIYKTLNAERKAEKEESLLNAKTDESSEVDLQIDIVKHIVEIKLAEADERKTAGEKRIEKQKLLAILALKKAEALSSLSEEEIQKRIDALNN